MKKQRTNYLIIWAILFIVYNVILFAVIPDTVTVNGVEIKKYAGAFWPGYIAITITFIGNLILSMVFFAKSDSAEKAFLNMPLLHISWSALIVTFIVGTAVIAIQSLPNWIGILVCLLILAFYAIAVVKASAAADAVTEVGEKVRANTSTMRMLTADAEALISQAPNDEIRAECKKVYEALRYSDPVSNPLLSEIETRMTIKMNELSSIVDNCDMKKIEKTSKELILLTEKRNNYSRNMK